MFGSGWAERALPRPLENPRELSCTRKLSYRKDDRAMRPIYGTLKSFQSPEYAPGYTFPEICNGLLFRSILGMWVQNLKFVALPVPEIIAIAVLGWGCERPILRKGRPWSGMAHGSKSVCDFLWALHCIFSSIFTRFRELPVLCSSTPLFPTPPLVSSKFPHVPLGVDGWPLDYEERRCWSNWPCN